MRTDSRRSDLGSRRDARSSGPNRCLVPQSQCTPAREAESGFGKTRAPPREQPKKNTISCGVKKLTTACIGRSSPEQIHARRIAPAGARTQGVLVNAFEADARRSAASASFRRSGFTGPPLDSRRCSRPHRLGVFIADFPVCRTKIRKLPPFSSTISHGVRPPFGPRRQGVGDGLDPVDRATSGRMSSDGYTG